MKKILLTPFIALSALGLILSIIVHIIALSGNAVPYGNFVWGLHGGIFVVWFPAILASFRLTKDFKRKDFWKAVLRFSQSWHLFFFNTEMEQSHNNKIMIKYDYEMHPVLFIRQAAFR
jgi:hypothetical protein